MIEDNTSSPYSGSSSSRKRRPHLAISSSGPSVHFPTPKMDGSEEKEEDILETVLRVTRNRFHNSKDSLDESEDSRRGRRFLSPSSSLSSPPRIHKRTRRRHPATIQTPGRRIPTDEESIVEPLTTRDIEPAYRDVYYYYWGSRNAYGKSDERVVPDVDDDPDNFSDDMILGELELDEDGLVQNGNEDWIPDSVPQRAFSFLEEEIYFPNKKLSKSLKNGDGSMLSLFF